MIAARARNATQTMGQMSFLCRHCLFILVDNIEAWIPTGLTLQPFAVSPAVIHLTTPSQRSRCKASQEASPNRFRRTSAEYRLVEMGVLFARLSACYTASPWVLLVALLYFANTMSYTFYFKHLVILDIMFIASGFLWRVVAGAVAIDVPTSPWLLTCTAFLALFLGFNKRRGELMVVKGSETRKNLKDYPELVAEFQKPPLLEPSFPALHTVLSPHDNPRLLITLPYVLYGIFRYFSCYRKERGRRT